MIIVTIVIIVIIIGKIRCRTYYKNKKTKDKIRSFLNFCEEIDKLGTTTPKVQTRV